MSNSREHSNKKKKDVWEKAEGEFYQENYQVPLSGGGKQQKTGKNKRDLKHQNYTSLLPSNTTRKNSFAFGRTTTNRHNNAINLTINSTMNMRGGTTTSRDLMTMTIPDLADLSIPDETKTYKEIAKIKSMPISLYEKKLLKTQLMAIPILKLKGWGLFKFRIKKFFNYIGKYFHRKFKNYVFLKNGLEMIENECGNIQRVFLFLKWTLLLNLAFTLFIFVFLILPHLLGFIDTEEQDIKCSQQNNATISLISEEIILNNNKSILSCCREDYKRGFQYNLNQNETYEDPVQILINGLMLIKISPLFLSPLFYGYFQPNNIVIKDFKYEFSMAYLFVTLLIYILSFGVLLRYLGQGIKEMLLSREGEIMKYSNLILGGWDHYTCTMAGAKFKRKMLLKEMKTILKTETFKSDKSERSKREKFKYFGIRLAINTFTFIVTAFVLIFIYKITEFTIEKTHYKKSTKVFDIEQTAIKFLPAIAIVVFNILTRIIFQKVGRYEVYSLEFETGWFLIRGIILYILSIATSAIKFSTIAYCKPDFKNCSTCEDVNRERVDCWESFFGENLYRLIFTDLLIKFFITFLYDPIRMLLGSCPCKIFKKIGIIKFNIARESLDIIYILILSWIGFYFAPLFPFFVVVYFLIVFYIKKFSLLYNSKGIAQTYRTTKLKFVFTIILLITLGIIFSAMFCIIVYLSPSLECGPFTQNRSPLESLTSKFHSLEYFHLIFSYALSPAFIIPLTLIFLFLSYYYYSVALMRKGMVDTLKHLLILEGHDKQYLFARLNTLRRKNDDSLSTRSVERSADATINLES